MVRVRRRPGTKRPQLRPLGLVHWQASWPLSTPSGQDVSFREEESPPESPFVAGRGDPFQGLKLGSCLTLGNELSEETHVLIKQEILLGKGTCGESRRVREPRSTALPPGSQSRVLWWWSVANHSNSESCLVAHTSLSQDGC